jgi:hypothetical protein
MTRTPCLCPYPTTDLLMASCNKFLPLRPDHGCGKISLSTLMAHTK